uniref:hypothetical protein n=1 Tax=Diaphorobacter aerolatus TaxID=1288495 RepID=UPI001D00DDB1|nr:hypothetical protein [Diaphorobacter aerolatus]
MLQPLMATLRLLARRWLALKAEIKVLDAELEQLTSQHASRLRQKFGVGARPLPSSSALLATTRIA